MRSQELYWMIHISPYHLVRPQKDMYGVSETILNALVPSGQLFDFLVALSKRDEKFDIGIHPTSLSEVSFYLIPAGLMHEDSRYTHFDLLLEEGSWVVHLRVQVPGESLKREKVLLAKAGESWLMDYLIQELNRLREEDLAAHKMWLGVE